MPLPTDEPAEPAALPLAHLGRPLDSETPGDERPARGPVRHLRLAVGAAAVIVVVGLVVGILLVNSSAPPLGRGAETAPRAAAQYLRAVNAGDESAAAKISCDSFADDARAQARSGADPGITFRQGTVVMASKTDATVAVVQLIRFAGGRVQREQFALYLARSAGRWLVCGRAT